MVGALARRRTAQTRPVAVQLELPQASEALAAADQSAHLHLDVQLLTQLPRERLLR